MLRFYTSLTLCPSDIRKIKFLLKDKGITQDPLRQVLITPLFAQGDSLRLIWQLKEQTGSVVAFDSGGYYVQTGKITYEDLYYPLLMAYRDNPWADIYTLPDHVPTSQDSEADVWRKVQDTVRFARLFFREMPREMQGRAMAVIQGRTFEQVDHCLKAYLDLGFRYVGFGSFGTTGKNSEVNVATNGAVELARYAVRVAHSNNVQVHFFGLGAPALVAMIFGVGADSFDSSSWIKSAGFGQIYLPFTRGYNISHRNGGSELQKGITIEDFERLKRVTGHQCSFCAEIDGLQHRKLYRALHNLLCIQQAVDMINAQEFSVIQAIYRHGSPKYQQEFEKWLNPM